MCDVCRMHFHHPRCPDNDGRRAGKGKPIGVCVVCESFIYQGESCFANDKGKVCGECIKYVDVEEIIALCGIFDREELFLALGFRRCDTN